jgi:hypothetical protein
MSVEPPPRVDGESDAAYDLFVRWLREIGPDQLGANKAAAAQLGISPSKFATLKSRHKWVARREMAAWDAHQIDDPELARVIDLRTGAGVALVGDVVDDRPALPPPAETHRQVQVRRASAAEAAAWRDNLASGVHSIAALGPKGATIVSRYFDAILTGDTPGGDLAFAAGLVMRHMLPPTIAHQVMTELSANAVEDRARALGLTHPERGRQAFADLAERIAAAGAIEDPRNRR